jgi:glycosyltransferase involved in cell wall biosynthesis
MTALGREFSVVHNIPSPYRIHLFNVLGSRLNERGWRIHVHYLASSHDDRRHWTGNETEAQFPATRWRDMGATLRGKEWHLNPGLIAHLTAGAPEWLMVGGPWDTLSGAAISLLQRAKHSVAWFEGNTTTPGRLGPVSRRIKRGLLDRYDLWAVPGQEGVKFAGLIAGADARRRCVILPNIVDEGRFSGRGVERAGVRSQLKVDEGMRLAIWPARLIPAKGIVPFLLALDSKDLAGWAIRIIGDGPLCEVVEQTIAQRRLGEHVALVRPMAYQQMPAIYAASDLFLLPSLHDPNPLSVVEAMHSGLPLLVSRRIGNFPEALHAGKNGWSLDPSDPVSIRQAVAEAFASSTGRLLEAGEQSRIIAREVWASEPAIERFLTSIQLEG